MAKTNHRRGRPATIRRSLTILKKQMPELAERYGVKSIGIFGSYVRSEESRRSDMDILVDFERPPDLFKFMDLEEHLARQLGVKVDLVPRGALRGEIGARILREVVTA